MAWNQTTSANIPDSIPADLSGMMEGMSISLWTDAKAPKATPEGWSIIAPPGRPVKISYNGFLLATIAESRGVETIRTYGGTWHSNPESGAWDKVAY